MKMLTAVEIRVIIDIGGTYTCQSRAIWQHKRRNRYVNQKKRMDDDEPTRFWS